MLRFKFLLENKDYCSWEGISWSFEQISLHNSSNTSAFLFGIINLLYYILSDISVFYYYHIYCYAIAYHMSDIFFFCHHWYVLVASHEYFWFLGSEPKVYDNSFFASFNILFFRKESQVNLIDHVMQTAGALGGFAASLVRVPTEVS